MDKTPIQLLEQWRKEAEILYPHDTIDTSHPLIRAHNSQQDFFRTAYIDGCKATHEKMQKELSKINKECDLLHECISKLYNYDINVPEIKECLSKIKNL